MKAWGACVVNREWREQRMTCSCRPDVSLNSVEPAGAPKSKHASSVAGAGGLDPGFVPLLQQSTIISISLHCGVCSGAQVTDLLHGPYQTQQKNGHGPKNKHLWLGLVCESSFYSSFLSACVLPQDISSPSSLGSSTAVEQEGLEDAGHRVSVTRLTP